MENVADVVLVGAGPAGCATALGLAARGHRVVILDRAPAGRDKVCGEGLMPHGLAALGRLGLQLPGPMGAPFMGIGYHVGNASARARFARGPGRGVRRLHFDAHLAAAVTAHPSISLRRPVRVRSAQVTPGDVRLQTDHGTIRARSLVAADGLHSPLRRQLGLEGGVSSARRYGVRRHFRVCGPVPEWVDVHAAAEGELYITPVGPNTVNVALLCDHALARTFKGDAAARFDDLVGGWAGIGDLLEGAEPVSEVTMAGPLRRTARDVVADATLLVGDAAGFVDAVTGEGMSLTLLSAEIAAEVLSSGLRRGRLAAADLAPYSRRRRHLVRRLCWLTEGVVWGLRRPRLAERVVAQLGRRPALFEGLLAALT